MLVLHHTELLTSDTQPYFFKFNTNKPGLLNEPLFTAHLTLKIKVIVRVKDKSASHQLHDFDLLKWQHDSVIRQAKHDLLIR